MKIKSQIQWGALLAAVIYGNFVAYDKFFRPETVGHWSRISTRSPASVQEPIDGPTTEIKGLLPLEDFFQYDKHSGYVDYKMSVGFWSDKGTAHFAKNGKRAIEDGLKKTFDDIMRKKGSDKALPTSASSFLIKEAVNKFVYNLKFYKLIDADFEIDFKFTPINVDYTNFEDQLKTNQLVNLNSKGSLLRNFEKQNKSFLENILAAKIPSTGHIYQYIGGAITIKTELLDTTWKISQPIPNPKKNAVKGQVTLRKYYRVNQPEAFDVKNMINKTDNGIEIKTAHFKSNKGYDSPYVTVDTVYSFNLESFVPKKERVIIHFGKLISLDKKHDNIIKRIFQIFKKSNDLKSSSLYLVGNYQDDNDEDSSGSSEFKVKLKSLEYNFKKKAFTKFNLSSTSTSMSNLHSLESKIKKILLKDSTNEFIDQLRLELLISGEKI